MKPGVIIGLDVGEKRIGVAHGYTDVKIAVPHGIVPMNDEAVEEIRVLARKLKAKALVVGLPRNSKGEETKQSQYVRDFATKLQIIRLPIFLQDESLTSVEAESRFKKDCKKAVRASMPSKKRNPGAVNSNDYHDGTQGHIDAHAAAIFLTDFLEANFG